MITLSQPFYSPLSLLLSSVMIGLLSALVYRTVCFGSCYLRAAQALSFPRYKEFRLSLLGELKKERSVFRDIADLLVTLFGAISLIFATFIYNNGQFRVIAVFCFIIGYYAGLKLLLPLFNELIILPVFLIKFASSLLYFPLKLLIKKLLVPLYNFTKRYVWLLTIKIYSKRRLKRFIHCD